MATVNQLIEQVIYFGGFEAPEVRTRARYLREAAILPASAKGQTPQVEAVHAAVLILCWAAHRHQLHAVAALRVLWHLTDADGRMFGPTIVSLIDWAAVHAGGETLPVPPQPCDEVIVRQGEPYAFITGPGARHSDFGAGPPLTNKLMGSYRPPPPPGQQPRLDAVIPWSTLQWLGLLVHHSREQAAALGIQIDTADTWTALGHPSGAPPVSTFAAGSAA